ncbi:MAG: hypothetical protein KatS3mg105_0863 [Gemmatales bacterium]|nr:MAG: hypothetical protein KatS3mg105_0863 [Gemmatales bacterium]
MVAGQRLANPFALHDDERDAIGQGPILVGTRCVEVNSFFIEGPVKVDDPDRAVRQQFIPRLLNSPLKKSVRGLDRRGILAGVIH